MTDKLSKLKDELTEQKKENEQLESSINTKDDPLYNLKEQKQKLKYELHRKDDQLEELPKMKEHLKELGAELEEKERENE